MTTGQIVLGIITAVAALLAAALSWRAGTVSTRQREEQARREEWWRRFQWATDLLVSPDGRRTRVGLALLTALADSTLAGPDELDAMALVTDEVSDLTLALEQGEGDDEYVQDDPDEPEGGDHGDPGEQDSRDGGPASGQDRP